MNRIGFYIKLDFKLLDYKSFKFCYCNVKFIKAKQLPTQKEINSLCKHLNTSLNGY